jgi:hypothetical protein
MRLPAVAAAPPKLPLLLALPLLLLATPAFADATLFIGSTTTPSNRVARGASIGISLLVIGFEFEYADTSEDLDEAAPSLRTGMGNVLLQTPFPIAGMQFYATTGAGGYREQLGEEAVQQQETHIAFNTGGGVRGAGASVGSGVSGTSGIGGMGSTAFRLRSVPPPVTDPVYSRQISRICSG